MTFSLIRFNREILKLTKDFSKFGSCRHLCTEAPASNHQEVQAYYRTTEHNPINHDAKHIGRLYTVNLFQFFPPRWSLNQFWFQIPQEEFEFMAKNAESEKKCEFMTWKTFQRNDTLQEQTFMVRKQYVEMIQYLKQINWPEQDLTKFILWGKKGTGKTLTLSQIFHFAHKSNFIVIHLPKLKHWFRQYTGVSFWMLHNFWIQFTSFHL